MEIIRSGEDITLMPLVHLRTIVWLHGLGDTARGFSEMFYESPLLPDTKMVLPTAPVQAVTINRGARMPSWYDLKEDFKYDPSMEPSARRIVDILQEESKHTDCLILGGLSQGSVMSLFTGLSKYEGELKAIIALSGYAVDMQIRQEKKNVPILWYHGARDHFFSETFARENSRKYLNETNLTFEMNPNLGHAICEEERDFITAWLKNVLRI